VVVIFICLKEHILNFLKTGKIVILKSDIEIAFLFIKKLLKRATLCRICS
jgi:hypothetical protein